MSLPDEASITTLLQECITTHECKHKSQRKKTYLCITEKRRHPEFWILLYCLQSIAWKFRILRRRALDRKLEEERRNPDFRILPLLYSKRKAWKSRIPKFCALNRKLRGIYIKADIQLHKISGTITQFWAHQLHQITSVHAMTRTNWTRQDHIRGAFTGCIMVLVRMQVNTKRCNTSY